MLTSILALVLAGSVRADRWANAIRDSGAELESDDWTTELTGISDSNRVSTHDSSRSHVGRFSFLTDTKRDQGAGNDGDVWCCQELRVPKAVSDVDTCRCLLYVNGPDVFFMSRFFISFRDRSHRTILWCSGIGTEGAHDTLCTTVMPVPDSGAWVMWQDDLARQWRSRGWSELDTIVEVKLCSRGAWSGFWHGQDVSWDSLLLRSIVYYDFAGKSIISGDRADTTYTPVATYENLGIKDDSSAFVHAEIWDGLARVYEDSQSVSIPKEDSTQIMFREWRVPLTGQYVLKVHSALTLDETPGNDTLTKTIQGYAFGIAEDECADAGSRAAAPRLSVAENPALDAARIEYFVPAGTTGTLGVISADGRLALAQPVRGTGTLALGRSLPQGVYFVRLTAGTRSATAKLVRLE